MPRVKVVEELVWLEGKVRGGSLHGVHLALLGGQECGIAEVGHVVSAVARGKSEVERTALCSG